MGTTNSFVMTKPCAAPTLGLLLLLDWPDEDLLRFPSFSLGTSEPGKLSPLPSFYRLKPSQNKQNTFYQY